MRKVLGLDIGVASVGWGIIDLDTMTPIKYGVRLFEEANAENNLKRRTQRGARRLKSRKVNRKNDLKKILMRENLMSESFAYLENPYEIRVKGLKEKLTNDELCTALLHIAKFRGSSLEVVEDDEKKAKDSKATKEVLKNNSRQLNKGLYVCEVQLNRLKEFGKIHGHENNFKTSDYVKELKAILNNQDLSETVQDEIISCITRRRFYYEGPGSMKSPTLYGRFIEKDGQIIEINLIEKMRGKCSIFKDQGRAPKMSYSAEIFNLLNDLNNLTIDGDRKISKEEKDEILKIVNEKGEIKVKKLVDILGVELERIQGFRTDKNGNPLLSEFKGYKKFIGCLKGKQPEILKNKELLNSISEILTKTKGIEERKESITKCSQELSMDTIEDLANLSGFTGYHSLSFKAINIMNDELYHTDLNQMQILHISNKFEFEHESTKGDKKIRMDENAILSPVARQAINEALKVVNQLRKEYGEFDSIVIETTRAKNSKEEKKKIEETQKYYESLNKKIYDEVGDKVKLTAKLREKVRLYLEQDGKCAYTLERIDLNTLLFDSEAYEVDHIIPLSVSLDDSYNNKVLVTHTANQEKGNLTPVMAFNSHKFKKSSYEIFRQNVLNLTKRGLISKKKCSYLLFDKDINKYEVMKDFINRNLVDTSYANRVILNSLQQYFKDNGIDTKVFTVKGLATNQFRKKIKLVKDREENYAHHAIDALIVASLMNNKTMFKTLNSINVTDGLIEIKDTGEVVEILEDEEYFDDKYIAFVARLSRLEVTRYSQKVDKKPNRQVSDQTIYSTRQTKNGEMVVKKYKDIYNKKWTTLADDILANKEDKYLMFQHDPKTFQKFKDIILNYYNDFKGDDEKIKRIKGEVKFKENPLFEYFEKNGAVRKYSKKENGPQIESLKYLDARLGNCIDITSKYVVNGNAPIDKKVVLLQISPYRADFYKTTDGKYKFVTIRYSNVRYNERIGKFVIDSDWYEQEKNKKKITEEYEYMFSFHRNELIEITTIAGDVNLFRFIAVNNDKTNQIEVKPLSYYEKKQLMPTIGGKTKNVRKFTTDAIGNLYEIKKESLKLVF